MMMDTDIYRPHHLKKWISILFLSMFLLIVPGLSASADPSSPDLFKGPSDPFCQAVQEILQSGKNRFKSIQGKLDLVSEEYFGRLTPPGFKECFAWLDGRAYHCTSRMGMTETEVRTTYNKVNDDLHQCLSSLWQIKEVDVQRTSGRRFSTYTSASNPIEIKVGERNKHLGWHVDFYFRH